MNTVTLSDLVGPDGVLTDGDWIESKDQDPQGSVRLIQLADIGEGDFLNKSRRYLAREKAVALKCTFLKRGDILLARMSEPLGRCCLFPDLPEDCVTVVDVCIIRPDRSRVDHGFLMRLLNSGPVRFQIEKYAAGTVRRRISRGNLSRLRLDLPDLDSQRQAVVFLKKIETLIQARRLSLEGLSAFLKSTFSHFFGPLSQNAKNWPVVSLGEALKRGAIREIQDGNHGANHPKSRDFSPQGVPFITANVIREGRVLFSSCHYLDESWLTKLRTGFAQAGDVLLSHKGTLGLTALLDKSFATYILSPQVTFYRVDEEQIQSHFLKNYFDSEYFQWLLHKEGGVQTTRAYLSVTRQRQLPVCLPPLTLQRQFTEIAEKTQHIRKTCQAHLEQLEIFYRALQSKIFKDELVLQDSSTAPVDSSVEWPQTSVEQQLELDLGPSLETTEFGLFENFLMRRRGQVFVMKDFLDFSNSLSERPSAQRRPLDSLEAYERAQQWLFAAIVQGRVEQTLNEKNNQISLVIKG